ncbi:DNA/RNA non-specific endonuclease [Oceanospirillum sediminis]|uniref:DNA/RNA non-specific endonuclease n=1 Tax=Oceanospirillum sediminis TaxID=2760088 RepID=A0A839IUR6_9GAMM|nr:DNA/RNA non-specific endonuclease [Oceanospirillum sediminis]MBB1488167.1 DNA/RNA non-specific endonuclease [Oceanospirillum sediminis]
MRHLIATLLLLTSLPAFSDNHKSDQIIRLDYTGFTIWLDCEQRGAVRFRYNAQRDTGNAKRHHKFYLDKKIPENCRQLSSKSYKGKFPEGRYDRGHLVPANHMDSDPAAIKDSNYMSNIIPQSANANRGAWLRTEEIIECHRDQEELLVIGGVVWGNDSSDDHFLHSHGIRTPDAMWKLILKGTPGNEQIISWIVPNKEDARRKKLDDYLVSIKEIEQLTGEKIREIPDNLKNYTASKSWSLPKNCNKG